MSAPDAPLSPRAPHDFSPTDLDDRVCWCGRYFDAAVHLNPSAFPMSQPPPEAYTLPPHAFEATRKNPAMCRCGEPRDSTAHFPSPHKPHVFEQSPDDNRVCLCGLYFDDGTHTRATRADPAASVMHAAKHLAYYPTQADRVNDLEWCDHVSKSLAAIIASSRSAERRDVWHEQAIELVRRIAGMIDLGGASIIQRDARNWLIHYEELAEKPLAEAAPPEQSSCLDLIGEMLVALRGARDTFARYADEHFAHGKDVKSEANRRQARALRDVIAKAEARVA